MFTGLVEEQGTVVAIEPLGDPPNHAVRLTLRGSVVTSDAAHGDSIAVDGCCLTVVDLDGDAFTADVMAESLNRTSLSDLDVGSTVNLERAAAVGDRLGGHIVQGHVDDVGTLLSRVPSEHWEELRFALPTGLARYVVRKGSITVSGVSLTVVDVTDDSFSVSLIPTTLADTTLGALVPGSRVNLEVDIVAKYVERLMTAAPGGAA